MSEKAKLVARKPETKSQNSAPQIQKKKPSQSMNSPVDQILFLQRTIGNQAVAKLIKSRALQAKLSIGQPGDIYEQEADRVAEQVMRMPEPLASKEIKVSGLTAGNPVQHRCSECIDKKKKEDEEVLRAKEDSSSIPEVTSELESSISAIRSGGQSLPESVRAFYEPRFDYDFSQVRVHTDAKAAQSAQKVSARAFTIGSDVVFGAGEYTPGTSEGKRLLAHELAHVVQQNDTHQQNLRINELREEPEDVKLLQPCILQKSHVMIQCQRIQVASGRYVGDSVGATDNLREEVLQVMDRLHMLWSMTSAEYGAEHPVVSALPPMSRIPIATIPKTIEALKRNEYPTMNSAVASNFLNYSFSANVGRGQTNNRNDIYVLQDALHADWNLTNSDYTVERVAVNAITAPTVPDSIIPKTIEGIAKMKASIAAGTFRRGEKTIKKAQDWIGIDAKLKTEVDVLRAAIKEIKSGKSVDHNKSEGLKRLDNTSKLLGIKQSELDKLKDDWKWLVDNRKLSTTKSYKKNESDFFKALRSPLQELKEKFKEQQTHYWLKNAPVQVLEIIFKVGDAELPADELWAYAFKEGLVDYIRKEIGLSASDNPTEGQLKSVSVAKTISGFDYLGLDDFMTELSAKREPLRGFLPAGFDLSKVNEVKRINEKGREVKSGEFPNMLMAIQALSAMLKRRRKLFQEDAKANGYSTPNHDELIYWTYVYFNSGEFGGKHELENYKGKRNLSDWIRGGEFPNAIKLLQSYQMAQAMKIF